MKQKNPKKKRLIPIAAQLMRTYTLLLLVFFLLCAAVFIPFVVQSVSKDILETQKQVSQTITGAIENYFSDMDRFSKELMNSDVFKQAIICDIPRAVLENRSCTDAINRACGEAYEMYEREYRIGAATADGVYIWLADRILTEPFEEAPHIYDSYDGYGAPLLYRTEGNSFLRVIPGGESSSYQDTPMIVLARSVNLHNSFASPQAMLEICVDADSFGRYIEKVTGGSHLERLKITVFGTDGQLLYGAEKFPKIPLSMEGWSRSGHYTVFMASVLYDSAKVFYQIPDSIYIQRILPMVWLLLLVFLLMLGMLLLANRIVSGKITKPISQLSNELEHMSLTEPVHTEHMQSNLYELHMIDQAVARMQDNLALSMQESLVAHTSELQSRLMALQSQMEPHFLYNTLSVISALSEQGRAEAVSSVCLNLSQMLRYVSAKEDGGVSLYQEVSFLKSYIAIMKERFPKAQVHISIPLDMMDFRVPKLVLQPLCENSFKHANRSDVEITVTGRIEKNLWSVNVRDNGGGFGPEIARQLTERCTRLFQDSTVLSEKVEGMGLVNIYARLALFYKDSFLFRVDENGTTIGGGIDAE